MFKHSLGPPATFITVLYKDSCNYHKSLVKSVRHSSYDKEALTAILVICESGDSPGNNSNVYTFYKLKKKKTKKEIRRLRYTN